MNMQITEEFLRNELGSLRQQQQDAMIAVQRTEGAIQACTHLLSELTRQEEGAQRSRAEESQPESEPQVEVVHPADDEDPGDGEPETD